MIKTFKLRKSVIFVIIFCIIFLILYYKISSNGNNIIKNGMENKINEFLDSTNNYIADVNVKVWSNKTENSYEMHQEVNNENSIQEVIDGENIAGMKIELNQGNLKISNTKLKLEKVYENYTNLLNNALFLNSFSADYNTEENESKYTEKEEQIILEVKLNNNPKNTYIKNKKLYLDSKTMKPIKLEVESNLQKETICIQYNNIEFKNS